MRELGGAGIAFMLIGVVMAGVVLMGLVLMGPVLMGLVAVVPMIQGHMHGGHDGASAGRYP